MRRGNRIPWYAQATKYHSENPSLRDKTDYVVTDGREVWETQFGPCLDRGAAEAVARALNRYQRTRKRRPAGANMARVQNAPRRIREVPIA